jgi:hypothetical protein
MAILVATDLGDEVPSHPAKLTHLAQEAVEGWEEGK